MSFGISTSTGPGLFEAGQFKRTFDDFGNICDSANLDRTFGYRFTDGNYVYFLESISAKKMEWNISCDCNNRGGITVRIRDPCNQIGGARTRGWQDKRQPDQSLEHTLAAACTAPLLVLGSNTANIKPG